MQHGIVKQYNNIYEPGYRCSICETVRYYFRYIFFASCHESQLEKSYDALY